MAIEVQEQLDGNDVGHGDLEDGEVNLRIVVNNDVLATMVHIET